MVGWKVLFLFFWTGAISRFIVFLLSYDESSIWGFDFALDFCCFCWLQSGCLFATQEMYHYIESPILIGICFPGAPKRFGEGILGGSC